MTPLDLAPYVLVGAPLAGIIATISIEVRRAGREPGEPAPVEPAPRRPDLYLVGGHVIHAEHRFAARRVASGAPEGPWAA